MSTSPATLNKNNRSNYPRNYSFYRNGNSATFFSYVCNAKTFQKVVLSYLKRNDCQCQFCVFNFSRSKRQIARLIVAHANRKRRQDPNKHGHCRVFFQSEPLLWNSFRSFHYARGNDFTDLCKPIETYTMLGKNTHQQVIPQQSTQTQRTCGYRHTTKTSGLF